LLKGSTDKPSTVTVEKFDPRFEVTGKVKGEIAPETNAIKPLYRPIATSSVSKGDLNLIQSAHVPKTQKPNGKPSSKCQHKTQKSRKQKREEKKKLAEASSQAKTIEELQGTNDALMARIVERESKEQEEKEALEKEEAARQTALRQDLAQRVKHFTNGLKIRYGKGICLNWHGLAKMNVLFSVMSAVLTTSLYDPFNAWEYIIVVVYALLLGALMTMLALLLDRELSSRSLTVHLSNNRRLAHRGFRRPWFFKAAYHKYRGVGEHNLDRLYDNFDLRSDLLQLKDLKYDHPHLADVQYTCHYGWGLSVTTTLTVSLELYSHICTSAVLALGADEKVTFERIHHAAKNFSTININRYMVLSGLNVVQDTELLALALWKQMSEQRDLIPFPRTPACP